MPAKKIASIAGRKIEEALQELLSLPIATRRSAVASDVRRRSPRYRDIPAHYLAAALGVPQSERPSSDWLFIRYAEIVPVDEYAKNNPPASILVYLIENSVDAKRFQQLLELSVPLDEAETPRFSFLLQNEQDELEHAIAERQLRNNALNGMSCIARYSVKSPSGAVLEFEGDIEDDGACIHLRTPYDKHAKGFRDLTRCVTDHW